MSVGAKFSARYFLARVENALQAVRKDLSSSGADAGFFQRFQEAYKQQLTTVMAITGAAMAPALNPGGPLLQLWSATAIERPAKAAKWGTKAAL